MEKEKIEILVACEESQAVTIEFRKLGFTAFSCDTQDCSGGHPEWHIKDDAIKVLNSQKWDLIIAHPPCTFMSRAGARWMYQDGMLNKERLSKALVAKKFFLQFYNYDSLVCVENPTPLKIIDLPLYTQAIQPYQFGHPYSKKTLLWLKGLPSLKPTNVLKDYKPYLPSNTGGKKKGQKYHITNISQTDASKTFKGIAEAMANQWGNFLLEKLKK